MKCLEQMQQGQMIEVKMNSAALSPWGKHIQHRLNELDRDWAWICKMMQLKGYPLTMKELIQLATKEPLSEGRKNAIEKLLVEEERRRKFRKHVGFRNLGKRKDAL